MNRINRRELLETLPKVGMAALALSFPSWLFGKEKEDKSLILYNDFNKELVLKKDWETPCYIEQFDFYPDNDFYKWVEFSDGNSLRYYSRLQYIRFPVSKNDFFGIDKVKKIVQSNKKWNEIPYQLNLENILQYFDPLDNCWRFNQLNAESKEDYLRMKQNHFGYVPNGLWKQIYPD